MDLRKVVLLKKPLTEISLNNSNASIYESATEDSDSESFYYSFNASSVENFDDSSPKKINNSSIGHNDDLECSLASSPEDKNDTVIQIEPTTPRQSMADIEIIVTDYESELAAKPAETDEEVNSVQAETASGIDIEELGEIVNAENVQSKPTERVEAPEKEQNQPAMDIEEPKVPCEEQQQLPALDVSARSRLDDIEAPEDMKMDVSAAFEPSGQAQDVREIFIEAPISSVSILLQDPNKSLVNPFTLSVDCAESPAASTSQMEPKKSAKKSATKIPVKNHLYSPLQRKSVDRNTKIIIKPAAARRTIYETRSQVTVPKKPEVPKVSKTKPMTSASTSKLLPKPTTKPASSVSSSRPAPKPSALPQITAKRPVLPFKCNVDGCHREFRSGFAYQQHMKSHNGNMASTSASASSSSTSLAPQTGHKCKWCDKKFEVSCALVTHMIESCTKISFAEKRKLIEQQEKNKPAINKRKSMFAPPEPVARKKSPSRRQTIGRKSGVVTPKKTMKCHVEGCGQLFTDVLAFANHMVSHKYDGVIPAAKKA